ncbi:hypothetical protein MC885_021155 [Smutsia gigantea]|nr:hypothetical protein MC885_021155 [Smutsia gigantea]
MEELRNPREIHGTPSNLNSSHLESKNRYCVDVNEEKPESGNRMTCNREERNIHCCDFESSQSSVISDTVVRFLNDQPAIDALQNSECLIKMATPMRTQEEKPNRAKGNENSMKASVSNMGHDVDPKVVRLTDSSPSSTSTSNSQRLDILKQRQHDVKLEKLKERIRKQWEHSEETNSRGQNLGHIDHPMMVVNVDNSVTAKVRKVAIAPPAPTYKGFNPSETKIRTPDGKVWQEAEFQNMSRELYQDLALHFADDTTMKEKSEKSKEKKVVKPVRKVQKLTQLSSLECKADNNKQEENTALNKDFLPLEIGGILDDLQLDSTAQVARQEAEELQNQKSSAPVQAPRSHSPIKRKPDKVTANEDPPVISKKRQCDTDEVRQYIVRQQEERKRKQNEEKKAKKEATEQKNKRLQELYRKQKEAFTKVKNVPPLEPSATSRLQETYSKLLLEKTLLEDPTHQHVTQEAQTRPGYQPSGESDKENKVQERPLSASSSSDMSLSEPPQPLARKDLMEPTWIQPDRLSPIESKAKKLAGANINYGSIWNTEYDVQQTPQEDGPWTKALSPPVKEDTEDVFSVRIQKMMGTCVSHANFDDDLPGVGNLSEFKKLPEMIKPHSAISRFRHHMAAELSYLSAIEESVRQLSDVERVRGISLAQQETVSLAQIIKAQQQRHERDLALLKLKAEQEALECQRQLEETRNKAAQVHAESLQQSKEGTPDSKHQKYSPSYDSYPESSRYKNHDRRSSSGSSRQESPSVPSSKENEKKLHGEKMESSIDEQVQTAADDSLRSDSVPSLPDEKDSTSIATECSLKFDESMTEDEIEEKSFRSLLPSESHRRFNMEKKRDHHDDSDEETSPEKTAVSSSKELSMPFSGRQDSFSKFTMEMVRQYMKEEEMRAAHQSSLLRLREKALKGKTKVELVWLEHQK